MFGNYTVKDYWTKERVNEIYKHPLYQGYFIYTKEYWTARAIIIVNALYVILEVFGYTK